MVITPRRILRGGFIRTVCTAVCTAVCAVVLLTALISLPAAGWRAVTLWPSR